MENKLFESILNEAETTKYMACCYDPEDYYEETNYIDEDGELSCSSSGAKLFNTEDEAIEYAEDNRPYGWASFAMPFNTTLNESDDTYKSKRLKETFDSTSAAFNLTKLKGYLRFETDWDYDEDYPEDVMLVDKVHEPPRFTVNWIGTEGEKHPNTYCVRTLRDRGESQNWEIHYFLKASDASEMINLEVGTWEHNNMSWKFESKASLFDCLLEAIEDFPKSTHQMYRFARRRHNDTGAIRKVSKEPYWVHPEGVAKIVMEHGGSDTQIKIAMAHDTMEDAGASYEDIVEKFGKDVADGVQALTNDNYEISKIGKEDYMTNKLLNLPEEYLFVKLADMAYNSSDMPNKAQLDRIIKNLEALYIKRDLGKQCESMLHYALDCAYEQRVSSNNSY